MASTPLPPAVAAIADQKNLAADATLVEVLPHMTSQGRLAVLKTLLERAHGPSLAAVVGCFNECDDALQHLLVNHAGDLFSGVRLAIGSPDLENRAGAIELIARSGCGSLLYLLADAHRSTHDQTRELAAAALRRMTADYLDRLQTARTTAEISTLMPLADGLTEALEKAVLMWEIHARSTVLEAALWLSERSEPAIRRKLREPRTRIAGAIGDILAGTSDPRLAGFALRALGIPALRASAARAIGRAENRDFIDAILGECWLLADPGIEQCGDGRLSRAKDGTVLRDGR